MAIENFPRHPDSPWHRAWKAALATDWDARTEVTVTVDSTTHRADAILPSGTVVELQQGYLDAANIRAREAFWARHARRIIWVYDASRFDSRLHWGPTGFWWKNGATSLLEHRSPIWWHFPRAEPTIEDCHAHTSWGRCPNCMNGVVEIPPHHRRRALDHHVVRIRLGASQTDTGAVRLLGTIRARRYVTDWFPSITLPGSVL